MKVVDKNLGWRCALSFCVDLAGFSRTALRVHYHEDTDMFVSSLRSAECPRSILRMVGAGERRKRVSGDAPRYPPYFWCIKDKHLLPLEARSSVVCAVHLARRFFGGPEGRRRARRVHVRRFAQRADLGLRKPRACGTSITC